MFLMVGIWAEKDKAVHLCQIPQLISKRRGFKFVGRQSPCSRTVPLPVEGTLRFISGLSGVLDGGSKSLIANILCFVGSKVSVPMTQLRHCSKSSLEKM